jgi:hypothetical protein
MTQPLYIFAPQNLGRINKEKEIFKIKRFLDVQNNSEHQEILQNFSAVF